MATGARRGAGPNQAVPRATLKAGLRYDARAKVYVGYAPALNIYSHATTEADARRALENAITLFLAVASNGRGFADILATAGLIKEHRADGAHHENDRMRAVEEEILQQRNFHCVFDVPASLRPGEGAA